MICCPLRGLGFVKEQGFTLASENLDLVDLCIAGGAEDVADEPYQSLRILDGNPRDHSRPACGYVSRYSESPAVDFFFEAIPFDRII